MENGAYGEILQSRFGLDEAPTLISSTLQGQQLAVTELRYDGWGLGLSEDIPTENAFLVQVNFRDFIKHEYWEDGRPVAATPILSGQCQIHNLNRNPVCDLSQPFHGMHFYFPMEAFRDLAENDDVRPIDTLEYRPGVGVDPGPMWDLANRMRPSLRRPQTADALLVDELLSAARALVARLYGGMAPPRTVARRGLSDLHRRRALELLDASVVTSITVAELAAACGLSISYFVRAFGQSMGQSPHQWLMSRRVEAAKTLLSSTGWPLGQVAVACGFADQSHMNRLFKRQTGLTPLQLRSGSNEKAANQSEHGG